MVDEFFGPDGYETASFDNAQTFDLDGLKGRLLLLRSRFRRAGLGGLTPGAEKIFDEHESAGRVTLLRAPDAPGISWRRFGLGRRFSLVRLREGGGLTFGGTISGE